MQRDILSTFLHTDAWAAHANATRDGEGNVFIRHTIPGGSYWVSTRCVIPTTWTVPPFTKGATFLRLQPDSQKSYDNLVSITKSYKHKKAYAIQPQQTITLDLTKPEETLLAEMKQKHRYNIKVADKNGVTTEYHTTDLAQHFPRFWKLLSNTAERHTFRTHTEAHYRSVIKHLEPIGGVALAFATHNGTDIAAFMIITEGLVGTYLHGGSSYEHRNLMAPYLLHWRVIQELKKDGKTTYDLWGVHVKDGEAIPGHASNGTTRFKLGFGGTLKEYPPTLDIILNPIYYTVYTSIQRLRSRKRAFS
jgi:lipid II:glycine glycyltransferase (peptidoglycan interpeptide bridge formation enzyme)